MKAALKYLTNTLYSAFTHAAAKPTILLIAVDDLRSELGYYGVSMLIFAPANLQVTSLKPILEDPRKPSPRG